MRGGRKGTVVTEAVSPRSKFSFYAMSLLVFEGFVLIEADGVSDVSAVAEFSGRFAAQWKYLIQGVLHIAKLRRVWAYLGQHLNKIKTRGREAVQQYEPLRKYKAVH